MTLPFAPPPHVELIDDVLPVELITRAASRTNDAREMMAVEHRVVRSSEGGRHDVVTVPIAQAFMQMPSSVSRLVVRDTPTPIGAPFGFVGKVGWDPTDYSFRFRISTRFVVTGIETAVRATHGRYAFGLRVYQAQGGSTGESVEYAASFLTPAGLTEVDLIDGVTRVLINVYGVSR